MHSPDPVEIVRLGVVLKYLKNTVTLRFNQDKCKGCMRCIEVCPRGVFAVDRKKVRVTDRDLCMECGACKMNCAYGALTVTSGVGCAVAIINGMRTGGPPSCDCGGGGDCC